MRKPRFVFKTKPRNGRFFYTVIEDHGKSGFMAQFEMLPSCPDPNDLYGETLVLDHYPTLKDACEAVNYPYDVAGLPVLK